MNQTGSTEHSKSARHEINGVWGLNNHCKSCGAFKKGI
jgi:hypothetical protein